MKELYNYENIKEDPNGQKEELEPITEEEWENMVISEGPHEQELCEK